MQLDLPHVLMPGSLLHGSTLQCRLVARTISLRAPGAVLRRLYDFDGALTPRQWLNACSARGWDADDASALLRTLVAEGVLVSVHDMPQQLWTQARNPRTIGEAPAPARLLELMQSAQKNLGRPAAADAITLESDNRADPLHRLLRMRTSKRHFGDDALSPQTLTALLWAAAGVVNDEYTHRTVTPSAGALYPLRHFYLNLRPTGTLAAGVYALSASDRGRLHYTPIDSDLAYIPAAFSAPQLLARAQGILVIAAEFAASARKYGARALSYVPLEAGHAAQNTLLAAAACDCHAVEIGGFIEQELAALLQCGDAIVPITTVVLGSAASAPVVQDAGQFEWVDARDGEGARPFYLCRARQDPAQPWSWGRDSDPSRAHLKATMESRERAALCNPQGLICALAQDLPGAIDPGDILRYEPKQYRRVGFPYRPFDPKAKYWWKAAHNVLDDSACSLLADLIYLEEGLAGLDRPAPYTSANTSGAASHTSVEAALENATLELIERDAFMRVWLGGEARGVDEDMLPAAMKARLKRLRDAGIAVALRDIGHAYCPVAFCFGQSKAHHFTRVSSCAGYDLVLAMDHALMELEAQIYVSLHNPTPTPIRPAQVREAADHAALYAQKAYFQKADRLIVPAAGVSGDRRLARNWMDLLAGLRQDGQRLIAVDLSDGAPIQTPTIKAFVPGLIPIKFGAGNEPAGHPVYQRLLRRRAWQERRPTLPHPFN
ncbi:YcaO-like family protein [Achromobacter piechaudii]|uniref:YcaO-like family protein n=1 Tax=Achromobacter piechaudii TaxID=72556 RepID=UPI003DA9E79B